MVIIPFSSSQNQSWFMLGKLRTANQSPEYMPTNGSIPHLHNLANFSLYHLLVLTSSSPSVSLP
ncbi:hypothetical protein NC652_016702 [Populus alba x Populus x berolinensis]|uniref:Uncharacterized protein n=1 Tax=Populus alba x Populus x berolinensis TaxID=444605 RepID=A0AAD6VZY1_9ROSI|nr:hypothetical protein NC652_016702 [Populus alba x Populus x berolinensis]KAJ6993556.1 hypothetical protein NC653_016633 [Populus alba x Populus x berolinensis]